MFVPVVDQYQQPLMPTTPSRACRWIASKKATPFWKRGVFCVRLNVEPSATGASLRHPPFLPALNGGVSRRT